MSSKYLWEDSLEIPTDALPWTPGMLGRIQKDRDLQIEQYLPFLYANVSTNTLGSHYAPWVSRIHKMPPIAMFADADTTHRPGACSKAHLIQKITL